jgi:hypothetical protein
MIAATDSGDLRWSTPEGWLVTGWFTPDYRPLAEAFAAQLAHHGAPYHIWAKPKLVAGWNTTRKPSIVLDTLDAYPGRTVVLMDVDCLVRGDPSPVADVAGDVGICAIARNMATRRNGFRHWLAFETSSRVIVFRPTDGARLFAERWAGKVAASSFSHDEWALSWTFLTSTPDVRFAYLPQPYSGREASLMPDAVIAHDSAHEKAKRRERHTVRDVLRAMERPFRTGRTKAKKLRSELGVVLTNEGSAAS